MAGDTRIELVLTDSKSAVLPLHKSPTKYNLIFKEQFCIVTDTMVFGNTWCCFYETPNKKPLDV